MASTMTNSFPIDPTKAAKYPVALSPELLKGGGGAARQHAVIQCMCDLPLFHLFDAHSSSHDS